MPSETITIEPSRATDPRSYVREAKDAARILPGQYPNFRELIGAKALEVLIDAPDAHRQDTHKLTNRLRERVQGLAYGEKTIGRVLQQECGHQALDEVIGVFMQAGSFRKTLIEQRRLIDELLVKLEPVSELSR